MPQPHGTEEADVPGHTTQTRPPVHPSGKCTEANGQGCGCNLAFEGRRWPKQRVGDDTQPTIEQLCVSAFAFALLVLPLGFGATFALAAKLCAVRKILVSPMEARKRGNLLQSLLAEKSCPTSGRRGASSRVSPTPRRPETQKACPTSGRQQVGTPSSPGPG